MSRETVSTANTMGFWVDIFGKQGNYYCDRTFVMGEVMTNFDKTKRVVSETYKLTFKVRAESIVKLSTKSKRHGIISKKKIIPSVYLAESLTR